MKVVVYCFIFNKIKVDLCVQSLKICLPLLFHERPAEIKTK